MARIFIEVKTPGNGKTYEFQIESLMMVGQVKERVIEEIGEIESGNITLKNDQTILFNLNTRLQLNEAESVKTAGIKGGQCLLLL